MRCYASFPLVTEGQVIGALTFGSEHPGAPPQADLEAIADIADQLAVAIVDARLHEQNRRHAEELETRMAERTAALRLSAARLRAVLEAAPIGRWLPSSATPSR